MILCQRGQSRYSGGMYFTGKRFRRAAVVVAMIGALALSGQPASAQTTTTDPYNNNPTTTTPAPTSTTVNLGARGLGSRFTVSQCGFLQGSAVTFTVNGTQVPGDTSDSNTCVQETFEIASSLAQALSFTRVGGMLAVTGLAARGDVVVTVNGQALTIGPLGSQVTSVAQGTGVNGQSRTVTVTFTVLRASAVDGSGGLARTGTTILKWSPLGAGLLAVGYMLVLVSRRRRAATVAA